MLSATIKGMLAHKLRLFLTATSIALGVAFLAGTLMLNNSMQRAFDDLFASVSSGMDTVVRGEAANAQAADIPGFMAYASLAEIVKIEVGWMPVD